MRPYERAGIEPDFREILSDPVFQAVLHRDGLTEETVKAVVRAARIRLGLASPCELVADEPAVAVAVEERRWRMPAIVGGRDGGAPRLGAGRCLSHGPLRLKCA